MPAIHDRSATVVNLHGQQPQWMGPAVLGMLSLQFCLLALIAWKMLEQPGAPASSEATAALEAKRAEERDRVRAETLESVLKDIRPTPKGYVSELQKKNEEATKLAHELSLAKEIAALRDDERQAALDELDTVKQAKTTLTKELEAMQAKRDRLQERVTALDKTKPEAEAGADKEGDKKTTSRTTWIVLASCIGVLAIAAGLAAVMQQRSASNLEEQDREHEREITATRIRPPGTPPPAATDEAVNALVGDPPKDDVRTSRDE